MSDNFSFIGLDGQSYNFPSLPEASSNYKHFIILKHYSNYKLFFFNNKITFSSKDGSSLRLNTDDGDILGRFEILDNSWSPSGTTASTVTFSSKSTVTFLCLSDSLLNYKEDILSAFSLESGETLIIEPVTVSIPDTETTVFTLSSIVGEVDKRENIVNSAFDEIFDILPVLMLVLISFIGIRKGISWLFSLLRHS